MVTLREGMTHPDVSVLRGRLGVAGFTIVSKATGNTYYDGALADVVTAYQMDAGLVPDAIVGPKTWASLMAAPAESWPVLAGNTTAWDRDMPELWQWVKHRMIPEYRQSQTGPWERMEAGTVADYVIPKSSDGSGRWGATCGHAAWLLTSWWCDAHRPDLGRPITWRTGRGPTSSMPDRCVWRAPLAGVEYGGSLHRGVKEYVRTKVYVDDLRDLSGIAPDAHWYVCQRDSGHVICVVRVDADWCPTDPRTGLPMRHGVYRLAADGSAATRGKPWTLRRMGAVKESGPWTCYGVERPGVTRGRVVLG